MVTERQCLESGDCNFCQSAVFEIDEPFLKNKNQQRSCNMRVVILTEALKWGKETLNQEPPVELELNNLSSRTWYVLDELVQKDKEEEAKVLFFDN